MRKTLLAVLLVVIIACTVAAPMAIAVSPSASHCGAMSAGVYIGLHAGSVLALSFLALMLVVRSGAISTLRTVREWSVSMPGRLVPSWIPPPVLLMAAAVDDPQIYNRGTSVELLRLSA